MIRRKTKEPAVETLSDAELLERRSRRMQEIDRRRKDLALCELSYMALARLNDEIRFLLKDVFLIDHVRILRDDMAKAAEKQKTVDAE